MDILERATAHFDRLRNQTVEVPEWGEEGAPLVVHFDPLTLADRRQLKTRYKEDEARLLAGCVMLFAKDADGKKLFPDNVETFSGLLHKADPKVIARIATAMMGEPTVDDLGNS